MDTTKAITHIGLCAGYGGIEMGLHRVIPSLRTIAFSEIEAFACANLVSKMEAGLLDPAPIWTDLKTFPWAEFRDRVDILTGGYPCQPFSAAGKRLGTDDPRHLWPHISAGIAAMRPSICFFENVEGHISLGLPDVIEDLAGMGYRTTWGIFSASEVGAPHQRKRVFILAYRHGERGQLPDWWRVAAEQVPVGYGETWRDVADTGRNGRRQDKSRWQSQGRAAAEWDGQTAWPSRPGELGNTMQPNGWQPDKAQQADAKWQCAAGSPSGNADICWPSRPGEQQFWWEPPRVVAHDHRAHAGHGEQRPERTLGDLSGGCGETMGNASERQDNGRESRDLGGTASQGRCGDHAADGTGEMLGNTSIEGSQGQSRRELRQPEQEQKSQRSDGECSDQREIKSALGRDFARGCNGLGISELSGLSHQELAEIREWMERGDNRTDELRLLGNGVVPATAERAFRVLIQELDNPPPNR